MNDGSVCVRLEVVEKRCNVIRRALKVTVDFRRIARLDFAVKHPQKSIALLLTYTTTVNRGAEEVRLKLWSVGGYLAA